MATRKHICGIYKGYRIVQEYEIIGSGVYGTFYPCRKINDRWYRIKNMEASKLEDLKNYIDKLNK